MATNTRALRPTDHIRTPLLPTTVRTKIQPPFILMIHPRGPLSAPLLPSNQKPLGTATAVVEIMSNEAPLTVQECFSSTKLLRAGVGKFFANDGRSFAASKNSGSKQKAYFCSGKDGGCPAEVRAFKIASGEWRITKIIDTHTNCGGGKTPGRSSALQHIANEAVKDNPGVSGISLKRKMERDSGIKVGHRTATRMKNISRSINQAAMAGSYQKLCSLCQKLQASCPGTVAEVEVSNISLVTHGS